MSFELAAQLIVGGCLLLTGCSDEPKHSGSTDLSFDKVPSWQKIYDEQQRWKRDRMRELVKTRPTYLRPKNDPDIYLSSMDNRTAMVDTKTGDFIIGQETDRERMIRDYRFTTKSGKLVCIFMVQVGTGAQGTKSDPVPYRVFHIEESATQTPEVKEARKRISFQRFAEFMTAFPDYAEDSSRQFVVIDAPLEEGEQLL
jgi:hypothetical protein